MNEWPQLGLMVLAGAVDCCDGCARLLTDLWRDDPEAAARVLEVIQTEGPQRWRSVCGAGAICGCGAGDVLWQAGAGVEWADWAVHYVRIYRRMEPLPGWFVDILLLI
ncbi:hypothetical protein [Deinococcus sedimenti]|uniref:Uncharacterized protein n=1 Tax=Deinococcus sedimenti TaxID=1867090 RepID=A0ABQ2S496_9DEIO|nr:hypothetical protein [Deinococcus sedimenti]GGR84718.1 hypothetical protein GCM10008960_09680 [Deinococcus sedimenti]